MDGWMDGWIGGWMDGWMGGRARLRIAHSNQQINLRCTTFLKKNPISASFCLIIFLALNEIFTLALEAFY